MNFKRNFRKDVEAAEAILAEPAPQRELLRPGELALHDARVAWARRIMAIRTRDQISDGDRETVVYRV